MQRDVNRSSAWRHIRETLTFGTTEKEARIALAKRMAEINDENNSLHSPDSAMTFGAFASGLWRRYLSNKGVKPSTLSSYESMLKKHLLPAFGEVHLVKIKPSDVTSLFDSLRGKLKAKYRVNLYALLRVMFEVAREFDLISTVPVRRKLHRPEHARAEKPRLTGQQIRRLLEHSGQ